MHRTSPRQILPLIAVMTLVAMLPSASCFIDRMGGAFTHRPSEMEQGLSSKAQELIARAFEGIDPDRLFDYHVHVVGLGAGGSGAFVHPELRTWLHPMRRLKFAVYASAAGITDLEHADRQYILRLADQVRHIEGHGRHLILAFDKNFTPDGKPSLDRTEIYVPNAYVHQVAAEFPDLFVPAVSVHPYRKDALQELERWARRGTRIVKWLPNAMGIDPADRRCVPFYRKMKQLDMILLTHAGEEDAVESGDDQHLGNPLRLRRPLQMGVKVIIAHCASRGMGEDLDSPTREMRDTFDLFLRLMEERQYEGLLFADISAVTQAARLPRPVTTMLQRIDLHHRLVNGSDYPMPAISRITSMEDLVQARLISAAQGRLLEEIYDYNPLLFDFVLKRTIRAPGTDRGFPASVFMVHPELRPLRPGRGEKK